MAIAAPTAFHDLPVAVPMSLTQPFGDYDVQGFANSLCSRIPEDPLCAGIPKKDTSSLFAATIASESAERMASETAALKSIAFSRAGLRTYETMVDVFSGTVATAL
jgi:hypothetical protein